MHKRYNSLCKPIHKHGIFVHWFFINFCMQQKNNENIPIKKTNKFKDIHLKIHGTTLSFSRSFPVHKNSRSFQGLWEVYMSRIRQKGPLE